MTFPLYLFSLNSWLHIVALALWIGALAFFLLVFGPAVRTLSPGAGIRLLDQGRRSLETLSWIAMTVVLITGFSNFLARGAGRGFEFGAGYYAVFSVKLVLFLAMVFHHLLQASKYAPRIASLTVQAHGALQAWPEPLLGLWKRWFLLLKINATLGPTALLLGLGLAKS